MAEPEHQQKAAELGAALFGAIIPIAIPQGKRGKVTPAGVVISVVLGVSVSVVLSPVFFRLMPNCPGEIRVAIYWAVAALGIIIAGTFLNLGAIWIPRLGRGAILRYAKPLTDPAESETETEAESGDTENPKPEGASD